VIKQSLVVAALGGLFALPACTSNQVSAPPVTQANVASQSKLQFQVGTANLAGLPGLNTVVTFRQTNGGSAVLVDTPTITLPFANTGPAALSMTVASAAGTDAGTNLISGTAQTAAGAGTVVTTFGQSVGAFSYGFLDANSVAGAANNSLFYQSGATVAGNDPTAAGGTEQPIYGAGSAQFYVGPGNTFVSNFKNGTVLTSFHGPPSGFTTFALTPAAGAYSLSVVIPSTNATVPTFTSTTNLTSAVLLPTIPPPTYTSDGVGGGTVGVTIPAGVMETVIFIKDLATQNYYTLVTTLTGAQTLTLPANLGPIANGVAGPSINPPVAATMTPGDGVKVIAVGFDYPAMEAVPAAPFGAAPVQVPVINNSGAACTFSGTSSTCPGQADLTMSAATMATE
jgi:hypothetical protein